jgi:NADH-quinone oxidoreductase subunit J
MMLDIDFVQLRQGFVKYLPVGGLIGVVLLVELFLVVGGWVALPASTAAIVEPVARHSGLTNTAMLGQLIYTKYVYLFQTAGVILFVAMIGAIVLTLRSREGVRRQSVKRQLRRKREESVSLVKVKSGEGI